MAESLFGISRRDLGRPFRDLDLSYRPVELRRYIDQAQSERRDMIVPDVEYRRGADMVNLEVHINPLADAGGSPVGVILIFSDVTEPKRLQEELELANEQLETAYEELQSTNEELETTNEELQSTVEELETTNEELQSSNEELETMNEELQSTNDELHTLNEELRLRSGDLTEARTSSRRSSAACAPASQCSTATWRCGSGTGGPRTSGACARTRSSGGTSTTSTSACPPVSSGR